MKKHLITFILLGLVGAPSVIGAATINYFENEQLQGIKVSLPSSYDGRIYASLVKNQQSEGNCWNYMANGLLETSLMKQYGITDKAFYDFSEEAMDRDTSIEYGGKKGFERNYKDAGNFDIAMAYWSRGDLGGPIDEKTGVRAPYYVKHIVGIQSIDRNSTQFIETNYSGDYIENKDIEQIKEWIYQYGAVAASYYAGDYLEMSYLYSNYPYGNSQELAYHFPGNKAANHGSILVGWDDYYSRENFNEGYQPKCDGAFLVKNSWGTNWGEEGYVWISYETAFSDLYAIAEVGGIDFYNQIYEYDPHGMIGFMSVNYNTNQGAYMNQYDTKGEKELLTAVSTYVTNPENQYRIYVSTDGKAEHLKEVKATNAGRYQAGIGYEMPFKGYMTFELEEPVTVNGKFLVAIEVTSLNKGATNVPIEINNEGACDNVKTVKKRGYIAENIEAMKANATYDVANQEANLCLKAFTKNIEIK
ncbi:MAG: hypothetical protein J6F30_08650 [Cellulosilyticum sp.]|nr:hypothetical protein [Cellulosilyticum sp.]